MIGPLVVAAVVSIWQPRGIAPTHVDSAGVIAAMLAAAAAPAQRSERWTYRVGSQVIPVTVSVRGMDDRASFVIDRLPYTMGRHAGVHWRADGNAIAHGSLADLQGDAADRLPDAVFAIDPKNCRVVGQRDGGKILVVADAEPNDRVHWFDIDASTGRILTEITKEGRRVVAFRFIRDDGGTLVGWHVEDGNRAHDINVHIDSVDPGPIAESEVALPTDMRTFAGPATDVMRRLPARFGEHRQITVDVDAAGHRMPFILDSGTENITIDSGALRSWGYAPLLEHATIPTMRVGDETLINAGVFALECAGCRPFGILGFDWFFGHVVHVDYAHDVVEVGDERAAATVFADPATTIIPIDVSQSIPFARAFLDDASGTSFALDTGSQQLMVFAPFLRENPAVAGKLAPLAGTFGAPISTSYLEGQITVSLRTAATFDFGPERFGEVVFATDVPEKSDLEFPFDGIIGTDVLAHYDLWFDYDNQRLGLRAAS